MIPASSGSVETALFSAAVGLPVAENRPCLASTPSWTAASTNPLPYQEMCASRGEVRSIRTGRFLSVDPMLDQQRALHNPQAWNRYAYVENNPINRVDPNGRDVAVAPAMQDAVNYGRTYSVAFAEMYNRLATDHRVLWIISGSFSALPNSRADTTIPPPSTDTSGSLLHLTAGSHIPLRNPLLLKVGLIGHEGAHVTEVLDTGKTLQQRYNGGERGTVYPNPAAGPKAYESTNALLFEQLVKMQASQQQEVLTTRQIDDKRC